MTTLWTKLGGTKFVALMVLGIWAMWMIQSQIKPDKDLLEFVKYLYWAFIFGNVGTTGIQLGVQTYTATKAAASSGTPPASSTGSNP